MPLVTPPTLDALPSEIITAIAEHLRAAAKDAHDFTPRIPRLCPCLSPTPTRQLDALVRSGGHYWDGALAFGMASKRLRAIVFDHRLGRSVKVGICHDAEEETLGMSEGVRASVRYVSGFTSSLGRY
jgi:hypothetical protein